MIPVSNRWMNAIQLHRLQSIRHPMYARVLFGEIDPTARADATITIPAGTDISADNLDTTQESSYAAYEGDAIPVNGAQLFLPEDRTEIRTQGWISAAVSGADGTFAEPPVIHVSFREKHRMAGVTLQFDDVADLYPDRFTVTTWLDGTQVAQHAIENDSPRFDTGLALEWFDEMTIEFTRTVRPYQRIHLQTLEFGIGYRFESDDIIEVTFDRSAHPLSLELPERKMTLTVYNKDGMFDADAATPIAEFFQNDQQATFLIGLDVDGEGTVEWIRLCTLWLDSWETNGIEATFGFVDNIARLNEGEDYENNSTSSRMLINSLRSMLSSRSFTDYELKGYVENMQISNAFPKAKPAQILQLAANLCMSNLETTAEGKLVMLARTDPYFSPSNLPYFTGTLDTDSETAVELLQNTTQGVYAAYEEDLIPVDGSMLFAPASASDRVITGAQWAALPSSGIYSEEPSLEITFVYNYSFRYLECLFPTSNVPSGIRIQAWQYNTSTSQYVPLIDKVYTPNGPHTFIYDYFENVRKAKVTFVGNDKQQKLRLMKIWVGWGSHYDIGAEDILERATGRLNKRCKDLIINYHTDGTDTQSVTHVNDYGEDCEIDNELFATTNRLWTDSSHSYYYNFEDYFIPWAKAYLDAYTEFECETLGYPELDAGDQMFYKGQPAYILKHSFSFSGGAARSKFTIRKEASE